MKVLIETSARHVHVSKADLEVLFGEGYELTVKKELSQPGQYACAERVDVVGPKRTLSGVSILGPCRKDTQVEISLTDARAIGVNAPIRESGDIAGSGSCKLVGPKGEVELKEGVIAAKRHIHMTTKDAAEFGVQDKQEVMVKAPAVPSFWTTWWFASATAMPWPCTSIPMKATQAPCPAAAWAKSSSSDIRHILSTKQI